ncbi:hypothetical protein AB0M43_38325 [Longispora sp. NPDC051575]|uniref:hypothetical protein n=1 Tax=Longispora sp. NPDC051575 TaxID=3154943 RepID=UPI003438A381
MAPSPRPECVPQPQADARIRQSPTYVLAVSQYRTHQLHAGQCEYCGHAECTARAAAARFIELAGGQPALYDHPLYVDPPAQDVPPVWPQSPAPARGRAEVRGPRREPVPTRPPYPRREPGAALAAEQAATPPQWNAFKPGRAGEGPWSSAA